jgi:methionine synthase II (cobalamin-independent)
MSSLWTPSGEHFPKEEGPAAAEPPPSQPGATDVTEPSPEEAQAAVDAMRAQLAETPAEVVIANHCYGLFELAAIYLSQTPPMLFQARLAIDALGFLLEGLKGRLGEAEPALLESLSQLRLVYVGLEGAEQTDAERSANAAGGDGPA